MYPVAPATTAVFPDPAAAIIFIDDDDEKASNVVAISNRTTATAAAAVVESNIEEVNCRDFVIMFEVGRLMTLRETCESDYVAEVTVLDLILFCC